MASRGSFSDDPASGTNSSSQAEASLGAIFQTAYTSATQGSRPSTELFEAADYFEDADHQLFAADSDHEEDRGVQALFVDTSSPRRSPMPGTSSTTRGPEFSFFPSPLMTSTSSLYTSTHDSLPGAPPPPPAFMMPRATPSLVPHHHRPHCLMPSEREAALMDEVYANPYR